MDRCISILIAPKKPARVRDVPSGLNASSISHPSRESSCASINMTCSGLRLTEDPLVAKPLTDVRNNGREAERTIGYDNEGVDKTKAPEEP